MAGYPPWLLRFSHAYLSISTGTPSKQMSTCWFLDHVGYQRHVPRRCARSVGSDGAKGHSTKGPTGRTASFQRVIIPRCEPWCWYMVYIYLHHWVILDWGFYVNIPAPWIRHGIVTVCPPASSLRVSRLRSSRIKIWGVQGTPQGRPTTFPSSCFPTLQIIRGCSCYFHTMRVLSTNYHKAIEDLRGGDSLLSWWPVTSVTWFFWIYIYIYVYIYIYMYFFFHCYWDLQTTPSELP